MTTDFGTHYWINQALQTRRYGHTYVHVGARSEAEFGVHTHENIVFSYSGWGRSLTTPKGHKYKVHARYSETGKPVPSKVLKGL